MCDSDIASAGRPNIRGASASRRAASRPPFLHRFNCRAPRLRSTSSGLFRSLSRVRACDRSPLPPPPSRPVLSSLRYPLCRPFLPLSVSLPLSRRLVFFIRLASLLSAHSDASRMGELSSKYIAPKLASARSPRTLALETRRDDVDERERESRSIRWIERCWHLFVVVSSPRRYRLPRNGEQLHVNIPRVESDNADFPI